MSEKVRIHVYFSLLIDDFFDRVYNRYQLHMIHTSVVDYIREDFFHGEIIWNELFLKKQYIKYNKLQKKKQNSPYRF